jgi:hypothetical protein
VTVNTVAVRQGPETPPRPSFLLRKYRTELAVTVNTGVVRHGPETPLIINPYSLLVYFSNFIRKYRLVVPGYEQTRWCEALAYPLWSSSPAKAEAKPEGLNSHCLELGLDKAK